MRVSKSVEAIFCGGRLCLRIVTPAITKANGLVGPKLSLASDNGCLPLAVDLCCSGLFTLQSSCFICMSLVQIYSLMPLCFAPDAKSSCFSSSLSF